MDKIFIPGNVPSLKNSKQIFINRKTGKPFISSSKLCKEYEKAVEVYFINNRPLFRLMQDLHKKPLPIKFHFVRDSKRKFDYVNVSQIILDLMTEYEWIEDDNADDVIPVFDGYSICKTGAGVYIYF